MKDLERYLERTNPWWISGKVEKSRGMLARKEMDLILDEMDTGRIVQLLGPRRAGKTTTLYLLIDRLLSSRVKPENILYLSLDDPMLASLCKEPVRDPLEYYLEKIAKEGVRHIFLDEVQDIKEWYRWLKGYHDRELNIQFIITGSSSLRLQEEANTYLRGRIVSLTQYPFDLGEFLGSLGKGPGMPAYNDNTIELSRDYDAVSDHLKEYMLVGGFPEWYQLRGMQDDVNRWFRRLYEDVPKRAFYEDIVTRFGIRNPRSLEILFAFIAQNQSRVLSYESMNRVTGLNRSTVQNYIEFLKSTYLLIEIGLYSDKVSTTEKANKKYLLLDQGIRNGLLGEHKLKGSNIGFIIENMVGVCLHRFCGSNGRNLNYIRSNGEIDFILSDRKRCIPVEVKSSDSFKVSKEFLGFMERKGSPHGVVITDRRSGRMEINGKEIRLVPFWVLLLGDIENNIWS
ncbi:MAG: ATP-binding protein [Candidatus Thermoplasmatota archaeon]|nr:ATP-binding protein [Candidatus Thermoplasmatota archaeon]